MSRRADKGTCQQHRHDANEELSDEDNEPMTVELKLDIKFMSTTLLKPLKKGEDDGKSKYTLHGQRAEQPLLRQLFSSCKYDKNLEAVYTTGLVAHGKHEYVCDSPDVVVIRRFGSGENAVPVEVKARMSSSTF